MEKYKIKGKDKIIEDKDKDKSTPTGAVEGAFIVSLKRNNKQIRNDRATAILEDTEILYKRSIEDLITKHLKLR